MDERVPLEHPETGSYEEYALFLRQSDRDADMMGRRCPFLDNEIFRFQTMRPMLPGVPDAWAVGLGLTAQCFR